MKPSDLTSQKLSLPTLELLVIVFLAIIPLFVTFPYRVNIFLSWEGAYRMSEGQLPFRDFGTPLGGMYWVIPSIFFKIFGTDMITLVKAQVFINILSGLAFRSILKSLYVQPGIRFVSVLLYCISFSFFNFWPWYNHTVIVYELIAIAFLLKGIFATQSSKQIWWLCGAGVFACFSFLTKQDAGGMAFLLCLGLIVISSFYTKKWLLPVVYFVTFSVVLGLVVLVFSKYGFGYWFNHGQAPHSARISVFEIINEFFGASPWIKFYLFVIIVLLLIQYKKIKDIFSEHRDFLFLILTLGILLQAAVFQVTSYTPPDNNIFFHSFAVAFILTLLFDLLNKNASSLKMVSGLVIGVLLWWSSVFWKYVVRIVERAFPPNTEVVSIGGENVVNRETYMIKKPYSLDVPMNDWTFSNLRSFRKVYMPSSTIKGIERLLNLPIVQNNKDLSVLNMSELTPLAVEMPYKLETGSHYPLWNHLGVGMFNKQAEMFESRIKDHEYDLVLFEYIPTLNNFFPFRVRDALKNSYSLIDSFIAPRRGDTGGIIEVYVKPSENNLDSVLIK